MKKQVYIALLFITCFAAAQTVTNISVGETDITTDNVKSPKLISSSIQTDKIGFPCSPSDNAGSLVIEVDNEEEIPSIYMEDNNNNSVRIFSEYISISDLGPGGTLINATSIETPSIITRKWKIKDFPDYVFEPDYVLPSLKDVESFVKKHKHLPEIPSGKEIAEKGMDLGDMNVKLLKKVEELTLYSIQQEKKIKEQTELLRTQSERMNRMERILLEMQENNEGGRHE